MRIEMIALILLFAVGMIGIAGAGSELISESIARTYQGGDSVSGFLTINVTNESSAGIIKSTLGGNITLIDLVRKSNLFEGSDYQCTRSGCYIGYKKGANQNSVNMNGKYTGGFYVNGRVDRVEGIDINIKSNAGPSCDSQLLIDVAGKSISNTLAVNTTLCGTRNTGCFSSNNAGSQRVQLTTDGLCESMELPAAPGYKVGAVIMNGSSGSGQIVMEIFDNEKRVTGGCNLPLLTQAEQEVSCNIEKPVMVKQNVSLCIRAPSGTNYQMRVEQSAPICGSAQLGGAFSFDYELFAQPLGYGEVNIWLADTYQKTIGESLILAANNYINEKYAGNCADGCAFPLSFSGNAQLLAFSNISLRYIDRGNHFTDNSFYELFPEDSRMSGILYLDMSKGNFQLPLAGGSQRLNFLFNERRILPNDISINITPGFSFDVIPRFSPLGVQTLFSALTNEDITSGVWNFGDGVTANAGKQALHRYISAGNYTVKVSLNSARGATRTQSFAVYAGNVNESLDKILIQNEFSIKSIRQNIQTLPIWVQRPIIDKIGLEAKERAFEALKRNATTAGNENAKNNILSDVLLLDIPLSFGVINSGSIPVAAGFGKIDIKLLEDLHASPAEPEKKKELLDALTFWNRKYYGSQLVYKTYGVLGSQGVEPILTQITLNARQLQNPEGAVSLIIPYPKEQITFDAEYNATSIPGNEATSVSLNKDVSFFLEGNVRAEDIGIYLAPELSVLGNFGKTEIKEKQSNTIPITALILIWALLIGTAWIALQEWYKRHYESSLFNNKDDLYNITSFLANGRKARREDDDSKAQLRQQGWNGEQIEYAIKKLDGKRTGMWEIPIFRHREQENLQYELMKRRQGIDKQLNRTQQGGARFIKRP